MSIFKEKQYVCRVCGFNIIGYHPNSCPFCGASSDNFITAEECAEIYEITLKKVSKRVFCIQSKPPLGLEHNAYRIQVGDEFLWIDCPSTFSKNIVPMNYILFTHHHFIAAANLYKKNFHAKLWIHKRDSDNYIANKYNFDKCFDSNFNLYGIESFHIDGHTNGFTCYIFESTLFVCDYVFTNNGNYKFNPYGPYNKTLKGAEQLLNIISKKEINHVCGYNYFLSYKKWKEGFIKLIEKK